MLGFDFIETDIEKYTDQQLKETVAFIQKELLERNRKQTEELINTFEKTFQTLNKNGVDVYVNGEPICLGDITYNGYY